MRTARLSLIRTRPRVTDESLSAAAGGVLLGREQTNRSEGERMRGRRKMANKRSERGRVEAAEALISPGDSPSRTSRPPLEGLFCSHLLFLLFNVLP